MRKKMKNISSKKWFFYISLTSLLCYSLFVFIAYNTSIFPVLYDAKTCSTYYLFSYLIATAMLYAIDTNTRKEPAFLTLFCLPAITCIFLILTLFSCGYNYTFYIVLLLFISLIYILSYVINKYLITKILAIKNGYANILFIYVVLHLMIGIYLSFRILGFI